MTALYLDLETFSETPITHGTHRYAENAEVLLVAYAFDDEDVEVLDLTERGSLGNVQMMVDTADTVVIHNSAFDRTVLRHRGVHIPVDKIEDTMVGALSHGLPGSLGQLCDVLGVPQDKAKDKAGKKLIHLFTKPRPKNVKLRRATRETHPEEWAAFIEYARLDVDAMRSVRARLPRWNTDGSERRLWLLDQNINDRGVAIDVELAHAALRAFQRSSRSLAERTRVLTSGAVASLTQRDKFLEHLKDILSFETPDLKKGTVNNLLQGELTDEVRELLEIRQQASATSPAKYKVLIKGTSSDGRLRGTLQFCGASRTGRWGGRLFQPQNLPRPAIGNLRDEELQRAIDLGIKAMKLDCEDLIFDNVAELCSSAVRGALIAPPGRKLVVSDLSNIEGRVLAWLAGEDWKIKAFADFDAGIGHDLYKLAYARSFGIEPEDVTKDQRQIGKVMELACLGPDTQVLTDVGPVAIKDITLGHKLWDGEAWVKHDGLIDRGLRETLSLDGVEVTEDHLLLVEKTWQSAKMVGSCQSTLGQALATGLESLKSLALTWASGEDCYPSWFSALVERSLMQSPSATCAEEQQLGVTLAPNRPAIDGEKTGTSTQPFVPMTRTDDACATAFPHASIAVTTPTTKPIQTTEGGVSAYLNRGEQTEQLFSATLSRSRGGTDLNSSLTELMSTGVTSLKISVSSDGEPIVTTCDVFKTSNAASTNLRPVYDIANAGPHNRFTILTNSGALIAHNCGYQGSSGAFNSMAALYGVELADDVVAETVQAWRKAHKAVVSLWYDLERAVKDAIRSPGKRHTVRDLGIGYKDNWLRIKLPSGRYLCYPNAGLNEGSIVYDGVNQYTKKWETIETYGGKLVENVVQAVARDVLASGMFRAEEAGYEVCLHVHDELITETPDSDDYSVDELSRIMATNPGWSMGLPLAAAGFETHRYRKD